MFRINQENQLPEKKTCVILFFSPKYFLIFQTSKKQENKIMKKLSLLIFVVLAFAFSIQAQTSTNNSTSSSSTATTNTNKKSFRATKDQIIQVQKMLKEKGKYSGAEDGKYNNDFRTSVNARYTISWNVDYDFIGLWRLNKS